MSFISRSTLKVSKVELGDGLYAISKHYLPFINRCRGKASMLDCDNQVY